MTRVLRTKRFEKELECIPKRFQEKVSLWVELLETVGLQEVRKSSGYHDEPLGGIRTGQRSIRLNRAYRVIYREVDGTIEILLLEVNKHDY